MTLDEIKQAVDAGNRVHWGGAETLREKDWGAAVTMTQTIRNTQVKHFGNSRQMIIAHRDVLARNKPAAARAAMSFRARLNSGASAS